MPPATPAGYVSALSDTSFIDGPPAHDKARRGAGRERVLALARRAGVHPAYLDRVLEGALPAAPADLARRLERAAGRPAGWLDRDCGPEGEGTASG
jgi:hypothetical protein